MFFLQISKSNAVVPWQGLQVLHCIPACLQPTSSPKDSFCSDSQEVAIIPMTQMH